MVASQLIDIEHHEECRWEIGAHKTEGPILGITDRKRETADQKHPIDEWDEFVAYISAREGTKGELGGE